MGSVGDRIKGILRGIPRGRVASYGGIAAMAGIPNGARTVARLLHSSSAADELPWWRVVRSDGNVALRRGGGFEEQCALLVSEGVVVDKDGHVDLDRLGWFG